VGGGAIGLSLAWRLRQRGATVAVLERGPFLFDMDADPPRGQASWAAAGILAPLTGSGERTPLLELGLASLRLYPTFLEAVADASGVNLEIQGPGMLRIAKTIEQEQSLLQCFEAQRDRELPLEWLDAGATLQREPALEGSVRGALFSPLERHVAPRALLCGLARAARAAGVHLLGHCPAEEFERHGDRALAVVTPAGAVAGGEFVLAGGAWTGEIARWLGMSLPVRPVRGQILALRCALLLSHTIMAAGGYLVPRADGKLIIGATEEVAGFYSAPTTDGVRRLLDFATTMAPSLAHAPFDSAWGGLRPGTDDGLPILGAAPDWKNVHIAAGHFKQGVLLTPITTRLMADWILERRTDTLLDPFAAGRFCYNAPG